MYFAIDLVLGPTASPHHRTRSARRVAFAQPSGPIERVQIAQTSGQSPLILVDLAWVTHTWLQPCSVGAGRSSSVATLHPTDGRSCYTARPVHLWVCLGILSLKGVLFSSLREGCSARCGLHRRRGGTSRIVSLRRGLLVSKQALADEDSLDRGVSIDLVGLSVGRGRGHTASEARQRCGPPWLRVPASRSLSRRRMIRLQRKRQDR